MQRLLNILGWVLIIGGIVGGVGAFFFVNTQEFVLALLARLVERPFEYRTYLALLSGGGVLLLGCMIGAIYVGLARILQRLSGDIR